MYLYPSPAMKGCISLVVFAAIISSQAKKLQRAACSKPPVAIGGVYTPQRKEYTHNETVTYWCAPPLKLIYESQLTCKNGRWSREPPLCVLPDPVVLLNYRGVGQQSLQDANYETCVSFSENDTVRLQLSGNGTVRLIVVNYNANYPQPLDMFLDSAAGRTTCVTEWGAGRGWQLYYCPKREPFEMIHFGPVVKNINLCEVGVFSTNENPCYHPPTWVTPDGQLRVNLTSISITCDPGYWPKDSSHLECPDSDMWDGLELSCVNGSSPLKWSG